MKNLAKKQFSRIIEHQNRAISFAIHENYSHNLRTVSWDIWRASLIVLVLNNGFHVDAPLNIVGI